MILEFRALRADEIDCRVSTINDKGLSLLLYKDARCDMNILDETVGPMNWERYHEIIGDRLYCTVSIYSEERCSWVEKQDVGTESYTEKEKGQASDSFKRACFNWGIGRELYTAPFIYIPSSFYSSTTKNGKPTTYDKFVVDSISIDNHKITELAIKNTKTNKIVFNWENIQTKQKASTNVAEKPRTKTIIDERGYEKIVNLIKPEQKKYLLSVYANNMKKLEDLLANQGLKSIDEMSERDADNLMFRIESAIAQRDAK